MNVSCMCALYLCCDSWPFPDDERRVGDCSRFLHLASLFLQLSLTGGTSESLRLFQFQFANICAVGFVETVLSGSVGSLQASHA